MDKDKDHKILDWFSPDLLTEFIDELREAGYNIGISQYIAAQDLVLSLTSQNLLFTPDRLGSFLGPILCSSSVEQEEFKERFRKWVELVKTRNSLLAEKSKKPDDKLEVELNQISKKSRKFKSKLILSAIFPLLLGMSFLIFSRSQLLESVKKPPQEENLQQPEEQSTPDTEQAEESASSSPNESEIPLNWQIVLLSSLLTSGVVYFAWRRWWLWQARLFLQRQETTQTPQLEQISFQGLEDSLFKPSLLLKTAQRLRHRVRVSANTLDINKTIYGSFQNGGWFTPAYVYRRVSPEYLFLIDRASIWDHQAKFIEQLTHQLRQNGVYITTYFFDEDPRMCFSSVKGILPQTLLELSSRYQQHRLIVFADIDIFFDVQTSGYAPWVEQLFSWQNSVIVTPKPLGSWGSNEFLLAQSLILLPLTETGIQVLGQVIKEGFAIYRSSREASISMPTMLKNRPKRWLERNPPTPKQAKEILVGLKNYLGDDGFYWLAACAIFPELRWHITLYLGSKLKAQESCSLLECCSLPNLARLPWYRYGYMPDWFRGYLIATLTHEQEKEVRLALEELLITAISGSEGTSQLEIAKQYQSFLPRLTRPILRILSKQASENTALKDHIFLYFMSGKSKLAVEVPEEIAPILRQYSQPNLLKRKKIRILKVIGIVTSLALVSTFSYSFYQDWVAERNEQHEAALNIGRDKYDQGNYRGAIADYTQAIELDPNYVAAYNNRGLAYHNLEEYQSAIADYTQAIELDPNYVAAYNNRCFVYNDLEEYQSALADCNRALELDPNYAFAYNNRGLAYYNLEEYQRAIDDYTQAIAIDPNYAHAYYNRGNTYRSLEEYQQALEDYQKAAQLYQQQGNTEWYQNALDRIEELQQ